MLFTPQTASQLENVLAPGRSYRSRRASGEGGKAPNILNAAAQMRLARTAATLASGKAREAVMKHTGTHRSGAGLLANMAYISREDDEKKENVMLLDQDGREIKGLDEMREIAKEWDAHNQVGSDRRKGSVSRAMILSAPAGTDPEKVLSAVKEWAPEALGDRNYVMALHTDEPHPHVHLTYAIRDNDLKRSYFNLAELQEMREKFAEKLQDRGLDIVATPRHARGQVKDVEPREGLKERDTPRFDGPERSSESLARKLGYFVGKAAENAKLFRKAAKEAEQSHEPQREAYAKSLTTLAQSLEQTAARERGEPAREAPPDRVLPSQEQQIEAEVKDERAYREQSLARDAGEAGRSPPDRSQEREALAAQEPLTPDRAGAAQAPPERSDGLEREPALQPGSPPATGGKEVVRLGNEYFDLADYSEEEAEILREVAEEERLQSIIELGGQEFDARDYDEEFAKELRAAAKSEKEWKAAREREKQTSKDKAPSEHRERMDRLLKESREGTKEILDDLEKRIKDRERDREGPTR